jgi:hypothetical protein
MFSHFWQLFLFYLELGNKLETVVTLVTVLFGSIEKSRNNIRKSKKPTKKRIPKILSASCIQLTSQIA